MSATGNTASGAQLSRAPTPSSGAMSREPTPSDAATAAELSQGTG